MNIYTIIAVIGLLAIIFGNLMISGKKSIRRRYVYPALFIGGICLEIYSIYIGDMIFIILQGFFIIATIYGMIKINERYLKHLLDAEVNAIRDAVSK
jgi:hypothetical protein